MFRPPKYSIGRCDGSELSYGEVKQQERLSRKSAKELSGSLHKWLQRGSEDDLSRDRAQSRIRLYN